MTFFYALTLMKQSHGHSEVGNKKAIFVALKLMGQSQGQSEVGTGNALKVCVLLMIGMLNLNYS